MHLSINTSCSTGAQQCRAKYSGIHCRWSLGHFPGGFSLPQAAGRHLEWLCAGFPPQHPPVAAELHPDTPACTCLGCTPEEIVEKICNHHYWDPLGEDCPDDLRKIIERCRAFEPSQRPSAEGKCPGHLLHRPFASFYQLLQQAVCPLFPTRICLALSFGILP